MPTFRPLPDRPNLEYVRKEAKSLLRLMQSCDSAAIERAHDHVVHLRTTTPAELQLADAQLVIARDYGFASWPRLVEYFRDVERQQNSHMHVHGGRIEMDAEAHWLLAQHGRRSLSSARALAAYVPRFFGVDVEHVLESSVSEAEARLAIARAHGAPSWTVLLERLDKNERSQPGHWEVDPIRAAGEAIRNADLNALEAAVNAHPELLQPSEFDLSTGRTLMGIALAAEPRDSNSALQPIMEWLTAKGFDRQLELNRRLFGRMRMPTDDVRSLLEQGADPNWIAPNGIPVLEHALLRYWNGAAVDIVAARTTPRSALWIAAGLGDVAGVGAFLHQNGSPTAEARRKRPDFVAVGGRGFMPALPNATDEEVLLEVLLVALLNGRRNVLEYLASRGAPINSMIYGSTLVHIAVGNGMAGMVECLLLCGADIDLRGSSPDMTTRDLARYMFEQTPEDMERRRIALLCGVDVHAVVTEVPPPAMDAMLERALLLASDDAARQGQEEITPENLLIGLLRVGGPALHVLKGGGRMDSAKFRVDLAARLETDGEAHGRPDIPMDGAAKAAVESAVVLATERRRSAVSGLHLLLAMLQDEHGAVGQLLQPYGVDPARVAVHLNDGL